MLKFRFVENDKRKFYKKQNLLLFFRLQLCSICDERTSNSIFNKINIFILSHRITKSKFVYN